MATSINVDDINALLKELEELQKEEQNRSVINMAPSYISRVTDDVRRIDLQERFAIISKIFLDPLSKLYNAQLNRINGTNHRYKFDLGDKSIRESLHYYYQALETLGFSKEQLLGLLPKTEEDVRLLVTALDRGYQMDNTKDNATKVVEARKYSGLGQTPRM